MTAHEQEPQCPAVPPELNFEARFGGTTPAPVVGAPTDKELEDFAWAHGGGYYNCDCQEQADILTRKHVEFARAVLARYGGTTPAPAPVPVSERLPGADDCDAEGRCWWFAESHDGIDTAPIWALTWRTDDDTHWLTAHALPLPEATP